MVLEQQEGENHYASPEMRRIRMMTKNFGGKSSSGAGGQITVTGDGSAGMTPNDRVGAQMLGLAGQRSQNSFMSNRSDI